MKPNFVAEQADTPSPGTEPQSCTGYISDLGLGLTAHTLSGANGGSTDAWLAVREPAGNSLLRLATVPASFYEPLQSLTIYVAISLLVRAVNTPREPSRCWALSSGHQVCCLICSSQVREQCCQKPIPWMELTEDARRWNAEIWNSVKVPEYSSWEAGKPKRGCLHSHRPPSSRGIHVSLTI